MFFNIPLSLTKLDDYVKLFYNYAKMLDLIPRGSILGQDRPGQFAKALADVEPDLSLSIDPDNDWLTLAYMAGFSKFKRFICETLTNSEIDMANSDEPMLSYFNHDQNRASWPCAAAEGRFFEDNKNGSLQKLGPFIIKNSGLTLALCTETTAFQDWVALRGVMYLPRARGSFEHLQEVASDDLRGALWQPTRVFNQTGNFRNSSGRLPGLIDAIKTLQS
jgi:hypothetical protein